MKGLTVYRSLLANRNLVRLLAGEFISTIGDWLYIVAIFVVIYDQSGDPALVGLFGAARLLPYVLLSVPAGLLADRFDRRKVLLISDLARGVLMIVLALLTISEAPTLAIAGVAILAACGSAFFYPAMGAYFPSIVADERQLGPANSVYSNLGNISFFLGPAIGGLLLVVGSVTLAFVVNAITFFVIALVLWTLPPSYGSGAGATEAVGSEGESDAGTESATAGSVDAPVAPAEGPGDAPAPARLPRRPLAGLVTIQLVGGLLASGLQVITVIIAIDVLKAGEEANGYLNAAIGVGGLFGGIAAGALVLRRSSTLPMVIGVVASALGIIALGASSSLPMALGAMALGAAGEILMDIVGETLFQRFVPNEMMGRAIGSIVALGEVAGVAGALALPLLIQGLGLFPALGGLGAVYLVVAFIGIALIGPAAVRAATPYEALIERVATLPLFTGVPRARLQTATGRLVEVPVTPGQAVVTQGERADHFYIIVRGSFTVTQERDGRTSVLRTLGPDQVFGELGLLNGAPRSATVTADEDGLVLALDGGEFLRLVGTNTALQGRLVGLYAGASGGS